AWEWTPRRRAAFANDVDRNLVAVTGSANTSKSDSTPAGWLPPDPTRHCFYAARYLTAAVAYGIPLTESDRDALDAAEQTRPAAVPSAAPAGATAPALVPAPATAVATVVPAIATRAPAATPGAVRPRPPCRGAGVGAEVDLGAAHADALHRLHLILRQAGGELDDRVVEPDGDPTDVADRKSVV